MGKRGPKPIGSTRVVATLPDQLRAELDRRAAERQQSLAEAVREALTRGLDLDDDRDTSDAA